MVRLKAVFAKLGVKDRVEAVVTAIQRGLIQIE
jgi:DNA-binding NarL/FixJ family response regulator